jgi:hypothetical protein
MTGKKVLRHEAVGTSFSFFSPEEVKKMSVKRITQPLAFDAHGNPVPDGLYDKVLVTHTLFTLKNWKGPSIYFVFFSGNGTSRL